LGVESYLENRRSWIKNGKKVMRIVTDKIAFEELKQIADEKFGDLVKAVVDVEKEIMVLGGELHSDGEALLLQNGSTQKELWGINLYPGKYPNPDWIEFDSIINFRPTLGNKTRDIEDPKIRQKIIEILNKRIEK